MKIMYINAKLLNPYCMISLMKKIFIALLLVPLTYAEPLLKEGESWDDFIEKMGDALTEIVCESSGINRRWASQAEVEDPLEYTDYFIFNDNYLFTRTELMDYETIAVKIIDITPNNEMSKTTVKLTNNIISLKRITKAKGLELISVPDKRYERYENGFTINRKTGAYKSEFNSTYYETNMKTYFHTNAKTSGTCTKVAKKNKF